MANELDKYTTQANTSSTDDYYELSRQEEFKTLLDREVALENSKANALKLTNEQMRNAGFGGTGYGTSASAGIYNAYMNQLNDAKYDYRRGMADIAMAEKEATETANALDVGNAIGMMQKAYSQDVLNKMVADYGYGTFDERRNFSLVRPEGMSDSDWNQIRTNYDYMTAAFGEGQQGTNSGKYMSEAMANGQEILANTSNLRARSADVVGEGNRSIGYYFDHEIAALEQEMADENSNISVGDYVVLKQGKNGEGKTLTIRMLENGAFVIVADVPSGATYHTFKHGKSSNSSDVTHTISKK